MVMPIKPATFPLYGMEPGSVAKKPAAGAAGGITGSGGATGGTGSIGTGTGSIGTGAGTGEVGKADFSEKLREVLNEANAPQAKAEQAAQDYASGKQNDLHGTMITMTEADVSLRLVSNVRTRVIEAYREVMRMGS